MDKLYPDVYDSSGRIVGGGEDSSSHKVDLTLNKLSLAGKLPVPVPSGKSAEGSRGKMADPFEVRMRFTAQLQHLNASVTSSQKAANYALKYKDMDEDLHSCILEQLEKNNMNIRANIMYFIEHFCEIAQREGHQDYVRMMQRDILHVVDAVAPEDGSGAANIKVVRKVLQALRLKDFLSTETVQEIEECLQTRGNESHDALPSHSVKPRHASIAKNTSALDKKQIEQRIEEDRERHKRSRESIWAVPFTAANIPIIPATQVAVAGPSGKGIAWEYDPEFERLYDETSDLGEDDYDVFEEESAERKKAAKAHEEEYKISSTLGAGGDS